MGEEGPEGSGETTCGVDKVAEGDGPCANLAKYGPPEEDWVVEAHCLLLEDPLCIGDGHHKGEGRQRHLTQAPFSVPDLKGLKGQIENKTLEGHLGKVNYPNLAQGWENTRQEPTLQDNVSAGLDANLKGLDHGPPVLPEAQLVPELVLPLGPLMPHYEVYDGQGQELGRYSVMS